MIQGIHTILFFFLTTFLVAQQPTTQVVTVAEGWANNSINTVVFRKNSLVSFRDTQFIAFYDAESCIVVGKRALNSTIWQLKKTILIFRDAERGDKVSVAICQNLKKNKWTLADLTTDAVGSWEPTYDTELWKNKGLLHLFVQKTEQIDGEGKANMPPQLVKVLETQF